jgi:hypothetical protein
MEKVMSTFLSILCGGKPRKSACSKPALPRRVQLELENLEERAVPAVVFHGGPVISHVDLETVYYGQDWAKSANQPDLQQLDGFARTITHSSYLAMLGEYGVGMGNFSQHDMVTGSATPANGDTVTDAQIQAMLANEIYNGNLNESAGQQVYLVYLPPGVHSQFDENASYLAHHYSFTMTMRYIASDGSTAYYQDTVPYAVIPDPNTNPVWQTHTLQNTGAGDISEGWTNFQKQTEVTSHELAEALTDPVVWKDAAGWHGTGWHDGTSGNTLGEEIGDIANLDYTSLDGYVVQRVWSNYFTRDVAPLVDTFGINLWGYLYPQSVNSGGRQGFVWGGGVYWGTYFLPSYTWKLDDGTWSGFFIPAG